MNVEEIIRKADANEGLTVEEIQIYQQAVKPKSTFTVNTERLRNSILKSITLVNC